MDSRAQTSQKTTSQSREIGCSPAELAATAERLREAVERFSTKR